MITAFSQNYIGIFRFKLTIFFVLFFTVAQFTEEMSLGDKVIEECKCNSLDCNNILTG